MAFSYARLADDILAAYPLHSADEVNVLTHHRLLEAASTALPGWNDRNVYRVSDTTAQVRLIENTRGQELYVYPLQGSRSGEGVYHVLAWDCHDESGYVTVTPLADAAGLARILERLDNWLRRGYTF